VVAGFADGSLELVTVQPPGKAPLQGSAWMNGRRGAPASFTSDAD
jgi:methionyl-tRNA formyltransferase